MDGSEGELPEGEEPYPPGWRTMAAVRWGLLALAAAAALFSLGHSGWKWLRGHPSPTSAPASARGFRCPMHPEVVANHEGHCPLCNMELVASPATSPSGPSSSEVPGLVPVEASPDALRALGVRTEAAREESLAEELRLFGRVVADPGRIVRLHARSTGFVEALHVRLGQRIRRGQALFEISSDELTKLQQEFLSAQQWGANVVGPLRERLLQLGVGTRQLARVEGNLAVEPSVAISSPIDGYLTSLNLVRGDRVEPSQELLEISDLTSVWVVAELTEEESAGRIPLGSRAELRLFRGVGTESFVGRVDNISPIAASSSGHRSLRFELENSEGKLLPGSSGEVRLQLKPTRALTVPQSAVLGSGAKKYVLVAQGAGRFLPRAVVTGASAGKRTGIRSGLRAGEEVVVSGQFFLEAEARLHEGESIDSAGSLSLSASSEEKKPESAPPEPGQ